MKISLFSCFALVLVISLQAQIKFKPPKIAKRVDTATQQRAAVPSQSPVPVQSSATPAFEKSIAITIDTAGLPIPDSIVIPLIDFNNQSIQDVLRLLSAPYGINLAVDPGLKAKVTLRLSKIKLKDAVLFIIQENGCAYRVKNGIIQVVALPPAPPAPPPTPAAPLQVLSVKDNLLTVDLKAASLDSVIRWLAIRTGQNIIPEKGMKGEITAYFSDMPLGKGMKVIFETNGLELSEKDGLKYLIPAGGGFDEASKNNASRVKYFVTVKNNRISFNVNSAPISDIVKEIAKQADLQVYLYSGIEGTITAKVDNASLQEALDGLLRNTSSTYWVNKNIYFFADKNTYEKKTVDIIPVNYLQANEIISMLPSTVSSKSTIKPVKEYNALLIEATTSDIIDQAKAFVAMLDKPIAQILIEAWVVEVKIDKLRSYGVKMFPKKSGQPALSGSYYPSYATEWDKNSVADFLHKYLNATSNVIAAIPENFAMQIQALENEGVSNLISRPQIATLNGHTATITFGTTQFYTLEKQVVVPGNNTNLVEKVQEREKIDVNMSLSVTPWVSSNNEVTMDISPNFDVAGASPDANTPPPINRRALNSKVRVKTGEMIILGGLIGESKNQTIDKVPFLGDIPLIGWLFSTRKTEKSKTQLMIYLIPHVYYGSERSIDPASIDFNSPKTPKFQEPAPVKKGAKKPWWKHIVWWK